MPCTPKLEQVSSVGVWVRLSGVVGQATGNARREKSLLTRSKIIRAAHKEFVERGFHGTTVASIAQRAGVAAQTVYFVFHTKADLVSAAIDAAVLGEDPPVEPLASEWWRDMTTRADAADALRTFIRGAGPIFERASPLGLVLKAASLGDEEVRRTNDVHDARQRQDFRAALEAIVLHGRLRTGLSLDSATDLLLTLMSDSAYCQLTRECGWSHQRVIDWWCEAIPELILDLP